MLNGYLQYADSIEVSRSNINTIKHVHQCLMFDHPLTVYHIKTCKVASLTDDIYSVSPVFQFNINEYGFIEKQVEQSISSIVSKICYKSEYEKAKEIYEYLICNYQYSTDNNFDAHTGQGLLLYGNGECDGFAKAFKIIADKVN